MWYCLAGGDSAGPADGLPDDVWYRLAGGGGGVGLAEELPDGVGEPQPQQGEDQHLDSHEHQCDQDVLPQPQVVVLQYNKILGFFFYINIYE